MGGLVPLTLHSAAGVGGSSPYGAAIMNLCCTVNPGYKCSKCDELFCVDCLIIVNKGFFKLRGGCSRIMSYCGGWSGYPEESKRHKVHELNEEAACEFGERWREVMEKEGKKGNYFWKDL